MITWYIIAAAWIGITIMDCFSNEWSKISVILKDLCILSSTIAIICMKLGI